MSICSLARISDLLGICQKDAWLNHGRMRIKDPAEFFEKQRLPRLRMRALHYQELRKLADKLANRWRALFGKDAQDVVVKAETVLV